MDCLDLLIEDFKKANDLLYKYNKVKDRLWNDHYERVDNIINDCVLQFNKRKILCKVIEN